MRMVKTVSVSFWSLNVRNEKAFNNNLLQMAAIAESTFAYLATETNMIFLHSFF